MEYLIEIYRNGHLVPSEIDFWLKFNQKERKIYGTPLKDCLRDVYKIHIVATDGFTR